MPHLARVFRSGNSQAIRLPKEFRFNVERVEVTQEGDALILRPHVEAGEPWSSLKAALVRGMSEDFMESGREQPNSRIDRSLTRCFGDLASSRHQRRHCLDRPQIG